MRIVGRISGVFLPIALLGLLAGLAGCSLTNPVSGEHERRRPSADVSLVQVSGGFAAPVVLITSGDGSDRLFLADQNGIVWVLAAGEAQAEPFLDIRDRLVDLSPFYDERGLLGLAFHPRFAEKGRFFVYYSAPPSPGLSGEEWDHTTVLSEFRVSEGDAMRADPASERVILSIDKPGYNYEAGHLAFGPDGYLYVAVGDSARNPDREIGGHAQDLDNLLGKILRIDVDGDEPYGIPPDNPFAGGAGRPEIYAYGLRNPYRFSFDAGGKYGLIAADVGHAVMEEVNQILAGRNYGWPIKEGTTCFNALEWTQPLDSCASQGALQENLIDPVLAYPHENDLSAVIGGYVYRGKALPQLDGAYIFGDWGRGQGRLFIAWPAGQPSPAWPFDEINVRLPHLEKGLGQILGFGEDDQHELYVLVKAPRGGPVGETGRLYRLVP